MLPFFKNNPWCLLIVYSIYNVKQRWHESTLGTPEDINKQKGYAFIVTKFKSLRWCTDLLLFFQKFCFQFCKKKFFQICFADLIQAYCIRVNFADSFQTYCLPNTASLIRLRLIAFLPKIFLLPLLQKFYLDTLRWFVSDLLLTVTSLIRLRLIVTNTASLNFFQTYCLSTDMSYQSLYWR